MKLSLVFLLLALSVPASAVTYQIQGKAAAEVNELGMSLGGFLLPWLNENRDGGEGLGILNVTKYSTTTGWTTLTIEGKEEKCLTATTHVYARIAMVWNSKDWKAVFCPSLIVFEDEQSFRGEALTNGDWLMLIAGYMLTGAE